MKKTLLSVLLASFLLVSPVGAQDTWVEAATKLYNSTVKLTGCSGFVIDVSRRHILTAAHCQGETETLVDGSPTEVVSKDPSYDLLVLKVKDLNDEKVALKLASKDAVTGEIVASMGYGGGLEEPMFRTNVVSIAGVNIESLTGRWVVFERPFVGGQSGGPVVNQKGEIVSIVQMSNALTGIGRPVKILKDKVGRYFAPAGAK
jgi:S1-C subfamily serine protease